MRKTVEIPAVEPSEVVAIDNQPKKTIFSLLSLIYDRSRKTLGGGEMRSDKAARGTVWVQRAGRNTRQQNTDGSE
jgi:hypothetical protein